MDFEVSQSFKQKTFLAFFDSQGLKIQNLSCFFPKKLKEQANNLTCE